VSVSSAMSVCLSARVSQQEALLLQRDRAMRYVSKFVLRFTRYRN